MKLLGAVLFGATALGLCQERSQVTPREFTNSVGTKFVRIEPGSFKMGAWRDHDVVLTKGIYLQTTEVTQAQWKAVMGRKPRNSSGPDRPVEAVSWDEVQTFLRKLNVREKDTRYRLPTEAEWEYACRAGGQEPDEAPDLDDVAWWGKNSGGHSHPVAQKKPNAWALFDMRGNVWEWVQDWDGPYPADPQVDPQGPPSGEYRVVNIALCAAGRGASEIPSACGARSGIATRRAPSSDFTASGSRGRSEPRING